VYGLTQATPNQTLGGGNKDASDTTAMSNKDILILLSMESVVIRPHTELQSLDKPKSSHLARKFTRPGEL